MRHLPWQNGWRRLSSLRFWAVFMVFRRLESLRHSFRKTLQWGRILMELPATADAEDMGSRQDAGGVQYE